jgi:hypothetical protein
VAGINKLTDRGIRAFIAKCKAEKTFGANSSMVVAFF